MTPQRTEQRLRSFIVAELVDGPFHDDDPLAAGLVDSLGVEQLIDYIEQTFGVELDDDEVVLDHFESVSALAALVDSKC